MRACPTPARCRPALRVSVTCLCKHYRRAHIAPSFHALSYHLLPAYLPRQRAHAMRALPLHAGFLSRWRAYAANTTCCHSHGAACARATSYAHCLLWRYCVSRFFGGSGQVRWFRRFLGIPTFGHSCMRADTCAHPYLRGRWLIYPLRTRPRYRAFWHGVNSVYLCVLFVFLFVCCICLAGDCCCCCCCVWVNVCLDCLVTFKHCILRGYYRLLLHFETLLHIFIFFLSLYACRRGVSFGHFADIFGVA